MSTNPGEMTLRPDALEPGIQVVRWRVVEQLGAGGQGAVYRVDDGVGEEVSPAQEGGTPERHLLRPPRPKPSWTAPPPAPVPVDRRSRWPRRLVLAAAVLLVLVPVTRVPPVAPSIHVPDEKWATDGRVDPAPAQYEQAPLPARNQKLAPCTAKLEVELSGACWHSLEQRPPDCPPQTVAYKGKCLWPVPRARPVPTSVDGGAPEAR